MSLEYLYRAVAKHGKIVDFLLTRSATWPRQGASSTGFGANDDPYKVAVDKSSANKAVMDAINVGRDVPILMRQVKYLDNIFEQDHRAIKRVTRPMLNFKSFPATGSVLAGIELMHMIRKNHFAIDGAEAMSFADNFLRWQEIVRPV